MESTLATSSSATGRVTFSHVFGQQCQLMEAGRKCVLWEVGPSRVPRGRGPSVCVPVFVSSLPRCDLECEVQLTSDVLAQHIHFKVSRMYHRTDCAAWAG